MDSSGHNWTVWTRGGEAYNNGQSWTVVDTCGHVLHSVTELKFDAPEVENKIQVNIFKTQR